MCPLFNLSFIILSVHRCFLFLRSFSNDNVFHTTIAFFCPSLGCLSLSDLHCYYWCTSSSYPSRLWILQAGPWSQSSLKAIHQPWQHLARAGTQERVAERGQEGDNYALVEKHRCSCWIIGIRSPGWWKSCQSLAHMGEFLNSK